MKWVIYAQLHIFDNILTERVKLESSRILFTESRTISLKFAGKSCLVLATVVPKPAVPGMGGIGVGGP